MAKQGYFWSIVVMFSAPFVLLGGLTFMVVRATRRAEREAHARAE